MNKTIREVKKVLENCIENINQLNVLLVADKAYFISSDFQSLESSNVKKMLLQEKIIHIIQEDVPSKALESYKGSFIDKIRNFINNNVNNEEKILLPLVKSLEMIMLENIYLLKLNQMILNNYISEIKTVISHFVEDLDQEKLVYNESGSMTK